MSNKIHRLFPAILIVLVALFMTACGAATPAASPAASSAASPSPVASAATTAAASVSPATSASAEATSAATAEATTAAEATTPAETTTSGTTSGQDTTPAVVAAANAFLATLSDTERESVLFDWTDTEQKQRWSNLPEGLYERRPDVGRYERRAAERLAGDHAGHVERRRL